MADTSEQPSTAEELYEDARVPALVQGQRQLNDCYEVIHRRMFELDTSRKNSIDSIKRRVDILESESIRQAALLNVLLTRIAELDAALSTRLDTLEADKRHGWKGGKA